MSKKKLIIAIIAIILVLSLIPLTVLLFAQSDPTPTKPSSESLLFPDSDISDIPTYDTEPTEKLPNSRGEADQITQFPYNLVDNTLVIEKIVSYDGLFFEDGSDKEVSDITAMILSNISDSCIEYVTVMMERDGAELIFNASTIVPGGKLLVIETNKTAYAEGSYSDCIAQLSFLPDPTLIAEEVLVEEAPNGGLTVTNLTDKEIPCVRIFYKYYLTEEDAYVGGITYTAKLTELAAGRSYEIMPSHYITGYSQVVMVKIYSTDQ